MSTPAITVHAGWSAFGVEDFSPFALKLKTYLRMAKIPYAAKVGDPRQAPTKKIPFITHEGRTIGDSGLIVQYLKGHFGDSLDGRLGAREHAIGHAVRRTCEESLYWSTLCARWMDEAAFEPLSAEFQRVVLPKVIGGLIIKVIRKDVIRNAWGQGMARHTPENMQAHGRADLDALATLLGDGPYLFGDSPTSYDASLFGAIANVLAHPKDGPLAKHARSKDNLTRFVDRVRATYWSVPDTIG